MAGNEMKEYELSEEDFQILFEISAPVPLIMLQCGDSISQQERANNAWKTIGEKMGFDHMTAFPLLYKGPRFFTATPTKKH